jgi:hypothetical protein
MQFARISVEAWNRLVASFTKKMAIDAEERQLRTDYDLRTSQYLAAKADLPN